MSKRFFHSYSFAVVLGLLLPGLGHFYWGEYLFGLFVLLVMVIASVLVFFSFLITLPPLLKSVLLVLPALFYIVSFVDLSRSLRRKRTQVCQTTTKAMVFVISAVAAHLLLPLSPSNFLFRNQPSLGMAETDNLKPYLDSGETYLIDRTAYRVELFFLDEPYLRATPGRWDLIAFKDSSFHERLGLVIGQGGEEVGYHNDSLVVDGILSDWGAGAPFVTGEIPLTRVEAGCILVATLNEGGLVGTTQISGRNIVGKVRPLF